MFRPEVSIPQAQDLNIQLHGSVHFGMEAGNLDGVTRLRRYDDIQEARRSWGISTGPSRAQDDHILPVVPMITGRRKADMMLLEPFGSYFHYFRQAAMTTPRWLIIGYGGGDFHVNAILATAAEKWGDDLRVVICNHLPESELVPNPDAGGGERLFYMVFPRQDTAGLIWDLFLPFQQDYYDFFRGTLSTQRYLRGHCGQFGRVLLTVDGRPLAHFQHIRHWLGI
jgi:hypothetical protein